MNVLWVFAHPKRCSLNGSLRDAGVRALVGAGHRCRVSDLYAMNWQPTVQGDEVGPDVLAEQEKIDWADAVVFGFPLWWYGMPAILKGWFDRVFVKGYAYGVGDPAHPGRTPRYGEGRLAGKRALVVLTAGGPAPTFGPRGINGELDQVLFPLLHGTLWYAGLSVLPPVAVYGADRLGPAGYDAAEALVRRRVLAIADTAPIPFRRQNGGDYDDTLALRPELAEGATGLAVHVAG